MQASAVQKAVQQEIVWKPIEGTSQELALDSRADITLYHGARGPGKTVTQLMRFKRRVGLGYGAFWRGIIFDVEFKNLADLVAQSKRFFEAFQDGAQFKESATEYKWVWPTGEELLLRHAKKVKDYDGYHGHEYPFIGWNELTKHAKADLYDKMMSTNRSSFVPHLHTPHTKVPTGTLPHATLNATLCEDGIYRVFNTPDHKPLPPIPLEVFSTTNPSGPGHNWVKKRFILAGKPGQLVKEVTTVFDPRTKQDIQLVKTQTHIFGSWRENVYLDPKYIAELEKIKEPNLRRAWLYGDWDVTAGGALDDIWNSDIHVLDVFPIPAYWRIDRAFDWGSTQPFCVIWFAECNGEEAKLPDGRIFCPPAGTLIGIGEWYGSDDIGENKGLKMSATKVAEGIKEREISWMINGHFKTQPKAGPADNQIRNVIDSSDETTEKKMANKGIKWLESDKSPGSRAVGLQVIRDRLEAAVEGEGKALYFMRNCKATIELLPPISRHPEKPDETDPDYEDHCFDVTKYRCLAGNNQIATAVNVAFPT
jgi:hypothetical protein